MRGRSSIDTTGDALWSAVGNRDVDEVRELLKMNSSLTLSFDDASKRGISFLGEGLHDHFGPICVNIQPSKKTFSGGPICVDMRIDMTNRYAPLDWWSLYRFHISVISCKSHHISRLTISTKKNHIDNHISTYCAYIENGGI